MMHYAGRDRTKKPAPKSSTVRSNDNDVGIPFFCLIYDLLIRRPSQDLGRNRKVLAKSVTYYLLRVRYECRRHFDDCIVTFFVILRRNCVWLSHDRIGILI